MILLLADMKKMIKILRAAFWGENFHKSAWFIKVIFKIFKPKYNLFRLIECTNPRIKLSPAKNSSQWKAFHSFRSFLMSASRTLHNHKLTHWSIKLSQVENRTLKNLWFTIFDRNVFEMRKDIKRQHGLFWRFFKFKYLIRWGHCLAWKKWNIVDL